MSRRVVVTGKRSDEELVRLVACAAGLQFDTLRATFA
jgi:hypothetical protein